MTKKNPKRFLLIVIAILVASELTTQLYDLVGELGGALTAVGTVAFYLFCGYKARKNATATFWFLLPCLVLTFLPLVFSLWSAEEEQFSWLLFTLNSLPFVFSFVVPVALLVWVYCRLPED